MKINKNVKKLGQLFLFVSAIGASIIFLFFVVGCVWIGYEVKTQCNNAKREYSGDCTEALISLLRDDRKPFRARNDAIWALGELGDKRALPVLQSYYQEYMPPREPLDKMISQYELRKAINLTSGGANITAVFWRYGKL